MINGRELCKNNDGSILLGTTRTELLKHNIRNWEFNRPPDMKRIPEIVEQLEKQDNVDGFVYLFMRDDDIFCYDGIHRIEALREIKNKMNHRIIVHYYPRYNEDVINSKFKSLNKCVPVPELYTKAQKELDKRDLIETIVKNITTEFSNMFKATYKPNIPHENRDNFTDKLQGVIETLHLYGKSKKDIIEVLMNFNEEQKCNVNKVNKLSVRQYNKCNENNCFLFITKNWDNQLIKYYRYNKYT